MKKRILSVFMVFALLMIVSGRAEADFGDFFLAKGRGPDLMKNGQYDKAVVELEKVAGKQDEEIQLALIHCYLGLGRDGDANRVAEAVSNNPEYRDMGDKVAAIYLEFVEFGGIRETPYRIIGMLNTF